MSFLELHTVDFSYAPVETAQNISVLESITISINKGDFAVLLGKRGSGKSTFLKLLNGLLIPTRGHIRIGGMDTEDHTKLWEIRRMAGMLFQEPDSQIIGATVAEDVAFGPENLGLPSQVIQRRVHEALTKVAMGESADCAVHLLSKAQKLRVSLAGILAMQPECILVDEAAAALDPAEKTEFTALLRKLNRDEKLTVIYATGNSDEVAGADRVMVLENGKITG